MKKVVMSVGICICLVSFAGCKTENKAKPEDSSAIKVSESYSKTEKKEKSKIIEESSKRKKSETSTSSSEKTEKSNNEKVDSIWNVEKASKLQEFMKNWGNTMGQSYKEYQPNNNVDFYGVKLPDEVLGSDKKQPIAVNDQIVSAEWSSDGQSSSDYSIVSVYSDAETAPYAGKHVYFFGFYNNQPVALVSMQNQGMPDGALHFKPTDNNDLNSNFQNIVNDKTVNQPVKNSNTWSSMDEAVQFYEDTYKNTSNEIGKNFIWENYDRSCWSLRENNGNRILLHWSNIGGSGGSYDEFVKNGDTTELTVYDGNASYPNNPSAKYTIRNSDHKVISTEELWNK